jgi:hypothetical protein
MFKLDKYGSMLLIFLFVLSYYVFRVVLLCVPCCPIMCSVLSYYVFRVVLLCVPCCPIMCSVLSYYVFRVVLLCVPCCDVRYHIRIITMFCSSLPPVVCRGVHVLFTLFVFVCVLWCPTHIVLYSLFCLSSSCVLCTQCCQFIWIVHS